MAFHVTGGLHSQGWVRSTIGVINSLSSTNLQHGYKPCSFLASRFVDDPTTCLLVLATLTTAYAATGPPTVHAAVHGPCLATTGHICIIPPSVQSFYCIRPTNFSPF